jgi:hypothetical protein
MSTKPAFIDKFTGRRMKAAGAPVSCPFCGDSINNVPIDQTADGHRFASSPCCGSRGPTCMTGLDAAEAWNQRRSGDAWRVVYMQEKVKDLQAQLAEVVS